MTQNTYMYALTRSLFVLSIATGCTVANPHRRPDAGPDGPGANVDAGDNPDASPVPGPTDEKVDCLPNLAFRGIVTASTSKENGQWAAAYAVDGNSITSPSASGPGGYSSQDGNPNNHLEWVEIHLREHRTFDTVVLYPRNDAGFVGDGFPVDFSIQVWDGANWLTRVSRTGYAKPDNRPQAFKWGLRDRTYKVRIEATNLRKVGEWFQLQLAEIQVSDSTSDANPESNQLMGASVDADSDLNAFGFGKAQVVDGDRTLLNGSSGYSSSYEGDRHTANHSESLYISTRCRKSYSKVVFYPRTDVGHVDFGFPLDFTIAFWNGTAWDVKVSQTNYPLPNGSAQTFSWGPRYTTDKIRIQATKLRNLERNLSPTGDYMFQLVEVEAYP